MPCLAHQDVEGGVHIHRKTDYERLKDAALTRSEALAMLLVQNKISHITQALTLGAVPLHNSPAFSRHKDVPYL